MIGSNASQLFNDTQVSQKANQKEPRWRSQLSRCSEPGVPLIGSNQDPQLVWRRWNGGHLHRWTPDPCRRPHVPNFRYRMPPGRLQLWISGPCALLWRGVMRQFVKAFASSRSFSPTSLIWPLFSWNSQDPPGIQAELLSYQTSLAERLGICWALFRDWEAYWNRSHSLTSNQIKQTGAAMWGNEQSFPNHGSHAATGRLDCPLNMAMV